MMEAATINGCVIPNYTPSWPLTQETAGFLLSPITLPHWTLDRVTGCEVEERKRGRDPIQCSSAKTSHIV